jgi:hypothetical protein
MNEHELRRQAKHRLAILRHAEVVSGGAGGSSRATSLASVEPSRGNCSTTVTSD